MDEQKENRYSAIDSHLYEDIDEEEMHELVWEAQREALLKDKEKKTKRPFPKWMYWTIAIFMTVNTFSVLFQLYSIPAIDFLITSAKMSTNKDIELYKKSIVLISTGESRGTGFSISEEGTILTNYHVVEGYDSVTVVFPDDGRYTASVAETYPEIDLAVIELNKENLPHLNLAEETNAFPSDPIQFIGNPLSFYGIANEGEIIDYIQLRDWEDPVVMIKAPVYRGNSGSPIINEEGKVIGVIFATLDHDEHGKVGLFIPIDYYYRTLE
ncbi:S1C family serine protease [Sporosarcina sp. CAU 1771]